MKKGLLSFFGLLACHLLFAQTAEELHTLAMQQAQRSQFDSAYRSMNLALAQKPNDLELLKDQTFIHVIGRNFRDGLPIGEALVQRTDADEQCYQILGMLYDSMAEYSKGEKMYRQALAKYPSSGVLYAAYGIMLWEHNNAKEAFNTWEKGIQQDVNNNSNYYYAAKYYLADNNNLLWGLLYGEIFINIESYTQRTDEMKAYLYSGYQRLYSGNTLAKIDAGSKGITKAMTEILVKNAHPISGDTILNLSDLRGKFIVDWVNSGNAKTYPFRLFDLHRQLIEAKTFTAYNEWLFGETANETAYGQWQKTHAAEMEQWQQLLHSVVFKIPAGQYYGN